MRPMIAAIGLVFVTLAAISLIPRATAQVRNEEKTAHCTLQVAKMTCGGCAAAVKMAAKKIDGVKDASVSQEKGTAEITYDPTKTTPEVIAKAITEKSGFPTSVPKKTGK